MCTSVCLQTQISSYSVAVCDCVLHLYDFFLKLRGCRVTYCFWRFFIQVHDMRLYSVFLWFFFLS